ncbi:DUF6397 family protein [Streptomyces sp. NPDC056144]|uniref:DUF6397 family protein n=1 Tax=unclassified Streptomyces TaxID=2593676 RepID=UPI0035D95D9C
MTTDDTARTGTVTVTRAAEELRLARGEFRLAVRLGFVRTVPAGSGAGGGGGPGERRRVEWTEIDRLTSAPDFPAGLRERVREVGTREAAALLGVAPDRFTRLARTGHLAPVRFYLNRYRAVVWRYLASEVGEFALARPALLAGHLPLDLRERLAAQEDTRARNWRMRRLGLLLRAAEDDPWSRAAALASMLDPAHLAEVVPDPYERARLDRLRPPPEPGLPLSGAAREAVDRLARAEEPDEVAWYRSTLAQALGKARTTRQAPRPAHTDAETPRPLEQQPSSPSPAPLEPAPSPLPTPSDARRSRLLDRILRRKALSSSRTRRGKRAAGWP